MYNIAMKPPIHKLNCPICNKQLSYIHKKGYYCDKCNNLYDLRDSIVFGFVQAFIVVKFLTPYNCTLPELLEKSFLIVLYLIIIIFLERKYMKYFVKFKLIKLKKIKSNVYPDK